MAELKKTRILLRSDIAANWQTANPVLLKGEIGIEFNPSVEAADRKIRIKIGDGVKVWNNLDYVADYDAKIAAIEVSIADLRSDIEAEVAALEAKLVTKVDKELVGNAGKSLIFNEKDGGGAKFEGNNGVNAYVGTHDNIGGEIGTQIYVDKADGSGSTIIDVTQNGAYYTKGAIKPGSQRDVEANEIAVKGDVAAKQDKLPDAAEANTFLKNDGAGNLSWVKFEIGSADWGHIGGDIEDQTDLMAKFTAIEAEIADRYTKAEVYTKTETEGKIADAIAGIKHWTYKVVDVLPEPGPECEHIIYLVPKGAGKTGYKEWVCINEGTVEVPVWKFEEIGDTDIDLSNYYNKSEIDAKVTALNTAISAEQTRAENAEEALQLGVNGLETRVEAAEADIADLKDDSHIHTNKDELDLIASGDVAKWNAKQDAITVGDNLKFENNKIELDFDILDGGSASDWND